MRSLVLLLCLAGCLSKAEEATYRDPTSLSDATTQSGITARVISPRVAEILARPAATLVLEAYTADRATLVVTAEDVDGAIYEGVAFGEPGPSQRFEISLSLLHGANPLRVRIGEPKGFRTRTLEMSVLYNGPTPGVRFSLAPARGGDCGPALRASVTSALGLCVRGRVSAGDAAIVDVRMRVDDTETAGDLGSGTFSGAVELRPDDDSTVTVAVVDARGQTTQFERRIVQDSMPPSLDVPLAAGEPLRTEANRAEIAGTVSDAHGVAAVEVLNDTNARLPARVSSDGQFALTVQLEPGANRFTVVGRDVAGNERRVPVVIVRERLIRLGAAEARAATQLRLDRDGLAELLTEEAQQELELVTISLRTPIIEALRAIREPERFGLDTSDWGRAETNMADVLRMTPDTANLTGSSIEELLSIAPAVGLPSPRLLAELLDIQPIDTFVSIENLGETILERVIATHPAVVRGEDGDPALRVSMFDALQDLAPVAQRFGPAGPHPGFLQGQSRAAVFEPGFLMSVPVQSNIEVREGVDASRQTKGFLFLIDDDSTISIDFLSDETTIVGIVDEPTVDLEFTLTENARFLRAGSVRQARPDGDRPGFYRGAGQAFEAAPWEIERVVAEAAYLQYSARFAPSYMNQLRYDTGSIVDAAVMDWDRGWVSITTSGGLGNPPPPTFVWDILSEVVQLRLHEGGIAEGRADLAFRLPALSIGIDAEGLIDRLRPSLQAQEAELADRIVNRDSIADSGVDLFFEPRADGDLIYFVAPSDIGGPYNYPRPGFFADAALTVPASTTESLGTGDTVHHKFIPEVGQSRFFEDNEGGVYRLDVVEIEAGRAAVRVVPVERDS